MKFNPFAATLFASFVFSLAGCSTFTSLEIAQVRQRQVNPEIVDKLERGRVLTPPEVIELSRRGVPESIILRQIDETGLTYVLTRTDVRSLRTARVSPRVIDALLRESDRFARNYYADRSYAIHRSFGSSGYWVDPYYGGIYGAYPYGYGAYPYGVGPEFSFGFGYGSGYYRGHHR